MTPKWTGNNYTQRCYSVKLPITTKEDLPGGKKTVITRVWCIDSILDKESTGSWFKLTSRQNRNINRYKWQTTLQKESHIVLPHNKKLNSLDTALHNLTCILEFLYMLYRNLSTNGHIFIFSNKINIYFRMTEFIECIKIYYK